jgi:3-oxoacyl-[acyl-carrier protein] reductase
LAEGYFPKGVDSVIFPERFQNQVAIITGGASGIGEGIARRIAAEGGQVILFDVDAARLQTVSDDIAGQGLKVAAMQVNIADEGEVRGAVREVGERFGRLDVMVNSAGIVGTTSTNILDYPLETFQQVVAINLVGSFLMTKYSIEQMVKRSYGRILLLASIGGKEGNPGMAGYAASKSGVIGLVKGIGKEYAEKGITVNGLAPAVISTPMNANTAPEMLKYMTERIPMKRVGTVDEAAAIACWIVSPEASFNTGFIFDLSGGRATF